MARSPLGKAKGLQRKGLRALDGHSAVRLFPERLRIERARRRLSQAEVADAVYVSQAVISYWERGLILPSIIHVCLLADFFDTDVDYLLGRQLDP